ncbi:MAG TPA: SelL-related redox protein [Gemmatimonadaceae bacterium]|nr:SelL-related redox protein [Gemmatimonadaceae bacterium]
MAIRVPQWLRQMLVFAGAWHLILGAAMVIAPNAFFTLTGIAPLNYPLVWQGIGVMTAVMGLGYAVAAHNPLRYWPVIMIGFIPKALAPLGFIFGLITGDLPQAFGALVVVHDLLWLVPFGMLLWLAVRETAAGEYPRSTFRGTLRDAMANAISDHGDSLLELSEQGPRLVIFLRHTGCIFCRETLGDLRRLRGEIEQTGVKLVLVHMGMPDEGEALAEANGLAGIDMIGDPLRELYQAFQLPQGSFVQLFGPQVAARGVVAVLKGHMQGYFHGDALQLPGAFVVSHGAILRSYRHTHAGDRPDYLALAKGECDIPQRGTSAA